MYRLAMDPHCKVHQQQADVTIEETDPGEVVGSRSGAVECCWRPGADSAARLVERYVEALSGQEDTGARITDRAKRVDRRFKIGSDPVWIVRI